VDGGLTLDDFTIDEEQGTVTCPAGQVRPMSKTRTVTFGAACAACPLRARCTTAKDGRSMTIHPHERLLRAARAQARTQAFKQAYPTRSMIERVIAWTATCNGRRVRLRYTGAAKNDAWLHNRCAAINLRTLLRHGLTRRDGAWVLAGRHPPRSPAAAPRAALSGAPPAAARRQPAGRRRIPGARAGSAGHKAIHRIQVIQGRPSTGRRA
jgi:Transposase DDE domain